MKQLVMIERFCLIGHIVAMAFGLAGLLLVLPHPEFVLSLSPMGQSFFQLSMAGGGVVYILLGAITVAIYAYRTLGARAWLTFMVPAVCLSLSSELLGTSTGFPFGHYAYLNGLGYKVAGLVPFTIPLSWFYLGFSAYLIARVGLDTQKMGQTSGVMKGLYGLGAIALGSLLLTSWDFVLDPAMSQTAVPFWEWQQPGAFFGMPYQNFAGWLGTGIVFMSVAAFCWPKAPMQLQRSQLALPLAVYVSNFIFAAVMSSAAGFWVPIFLGILLGVAPALILWRMARTAPLEQADNALASTTLNFGLTIESSVQSEDSIAPAGVLPK